MKKASMLAGVIIFVAASALMVCAQTQVFVPGNASGFFGRAAHALVPLVPALTLTGPGTITVTYVSGTVTDGDAGEIGPEGTVWNIGPNQAPLQESQSIAGGKIKNFNALIGVFVPAARVSHSGFTPVDGTKDATRVGIMPGGLFFIGQGKTFEAKEPGTLFLGINDYAVNDNGGGFNVEVTAQ